MLKNKRFFLTSYPLTASFLAVLLLAIPLLSACDPAPSGSSAGTGPTDAENVLPVIFVPGITGSVLVSTEDSFPLWPPGGPGADIDYSSLRDDFRRLSINPATGPHEELYASDVIRDYGSDPIYSPFLNHLKEEGDYIEYEVQGNPARRTTQGAFTGQKPVPSLFVFAYDWRLPIEENAHLLSEYVEVVNGYYPDKKVNIVTHSMGGLVARRYIIDHPDKVEKLITVAAPFLGSAKPLYQMIYGKLSAPAYYGLEATIAGLTEFLTGGPVQDMVAYYPGLHELMLSRGYFALGGPPYTVVETVSEAAEEGRLPETKEIDYVDLIGPGGIVDQLFPDPNVNGKSPAKTNRDFHSYTANGNNQDDWSADTTGVKYYHLIGVQSGHDTPLSIRESHGLAAAQVRDYALNLYGPGDGTVPRLSAERIGNGQNYNAPGAQLFVFDKGDDALLEHTGLMKNPEVMAKVLELLREKEKPGWKLTETLTDPPRGFQEFDTEDSRRLELNITDSNFRLMLSRDVVSWKTGEEIKYSVTFDFGFIPPPQNLSPGPRTFDVNLTVSSSGNVPAEGVSGEMRLQLWGVDENQSPLWQWESGQTVEQFKYNWSPGQPTTVSRSFPYTVPETVDEAKIGIRITDGIPGLDGYIEWVYRPDEDQP